MLQGPGRGGSGQDRLRQDLGLRLASGGANPCQGLCQTVPEEGLDSRFETCPATVSSACLGLPPRFILFAVPCVFLRYEPCGESWLLGFSAMAPKSLRGAPVRDHRTDTGAGEADFQRL